MIVCSRKNLCYNSVYIIISVKINWRYLSIFQRKPFSFHGFFFGRRVWWRNDMFVRYIFDYRLLCSMRSIICGLVDYPSKTFLCAFHNEQQWIVPNDIFWNVTGTWEGGYSTPKRPPQLRHCCFIVGARAWHTSEPKLIYFFPLDIRLLNSDITTTVHIPQPCASTACVRCPRRPGNILTTSG